MYLNSKVSFPKLADIKEFASKVGLEPIRINSRPKAISHLMKSLMGLPIEQLKGKLGLAMPLSNGKDHRSYEGWSDLILNKKQSIDVKDENIG